MTFFSSEPRHNSLNSVGKYIETKKNDSENKNPEINKVTLGVTNYPHKYV